MATIGEEVSAPVRQLPWWGKWIIMGFVGSALIASGNLAKQRGENRRHLDAVLLCLDSGVPTDVCIRIARGSKS